MEENKIEEASKDEAKNESVANNGVDELKEWLFGRVADDNDIVVDEMQEEFADFYDQTESSLLKGTEEYQRNLKHLESSILEAKNQRVTKEKQKVHDGVFECWYGGRKDEADRPHGQGMLKYPHNGDTFQVSFA